MNITIYKKYYLIGWINLNSTVKNLKELLIEYLIDEIKKINNNESKNT